MGYAVRVTRAKYWSVNQDCWIAPHEWLALIARDSALKHEPSNGEHAVVYHDYWLDWRDGNIYTENPDEFLLRKMVEIAGALNGTVQGEDGEQYTADNITRVPFMEWMGNIMQDGSRRPPTLRTNDDAPFAIGDKVKDVYGRVAEVIALDAGAQHGLGELTIAYDDDRSLRTFQFKGHGLEKV
jgi:hypothetical protein